MVPLAEGAGHPAGEVVACFVGEGAVATVADVAACLPPLFGGHRGHIRAQRGGMKGGGTVDHAFLMLSTGRRALWICGKENGSLLLRNFILVARRETLAPSKESVAV